MTSLNNVLHALQMRFAPSHFDDPQGVLFKLTQTLRVRVCQTQFQLLSDPVISFLLIF